MGYWLKSVKNLPANFHWYIFLVGDYRNKSFINDLFRNDFNIIADRLGEHSAIVGQSSKSKVENELLKSLNGISYNKAKKLSFAEKKSPGLLLVNEHPTKLSNATKIVYIPFLCLEKAYTNTNELIDDIIDFVAYESDRLVRKSNSIINRMCLSQRIITINYNFKKDLFKGSCEYKEIDIFEEDEISCFLSYCWKNGEIVNFIDNYLSSKQVAVSRDIRDIDDWQSISSFMKTINEKDFVVPVISDDYLKSRNCMYEIHELFKDKNYKDRVYPIVVDKFIYDHKNWINYIKFWEKECNELREQLRQIDPSNTAELVEELKKKNKITQNISEFLQILSDMKNPNINNFQEAMDNLINKLKNGGLRNG